MISTDISHADYLRIPAVSNSFLKKFAKTPAHGKYALANPTAPTEEMTLGTLEHCLIFEPHKLQARFHIESERLNWVKKEGKEQQARVKEIEEQGGEVIYPFQISKAQRMADAVRNHPDAGALLRREGGCEVSITSEISGVAVKCRVDKFSGDFKNQQIVDLKTTRDASAWAFGKTCNDLRYHVQAAMYMDIARAEGLDVDGFVIVAVESEPPYCVATYEIDAAAIMLGREIYMAQLELYTECKELDEWPGYSLKRQILYLPAYAFKSDRL